jgi:putative ABC transport system permease protein
MAAGKLISSQLYGVSIYDPPALGLAVVALATAAFVAAIIPASRAASIHPMTALRTE